MLHVAIEVILAAFHIGEEQREDRDSLEKRFLIWFNRLWGYEAWDDFPLSDERNKLVNTLGLGFALIALAVIGHWWWSPAEAIFLGFIALDAAIHLGLSLVPTVRMRTEMLSPGWVTSFGYLILVFWQWEVVATHPWWAALGGLALVLTYAEAGFKVWRRHRRERLEEMMGAAHRQAEETIVEFRRRHRDGDGPSGPGVGVGF